MQLMVAGKKKAFDELYQRYARKMHFFFYKMLRNDTDKADDFLQDLFLKLIEKPQSFNTQLKFSSWLYQVAGNMCRNEYRRLTVRNEIKVEAEVMEIHHFENENLNLNLDKQLFIQELNEALDQLEEQQRLICVLRFYEELSVAEISKIVDCPEGTVKSRIFYTLKKLSAQLKAHHPNL